MDIAEKLTDFDINTLISRLRFRHLKLIIALDEFQTVQRAAEEVEGAAAQMLHPRHGDIGIFNIQNAADAAGGTGVELDEAQ